MAFSHKEPGRLSRALMQFDPAVQRYSDLKMRHEIVETIDDDEERYQGLTRSELERRERIARGQERRLKDREKRLEKLQKEIAKQRSRGVPDSRLKGQLRELAGLVKEIHQIRTGK